MSEQAVGLQEFTLTATRCVACVKFFFGTARSVGHKSSNTAKCLILGHFFISAK